MIKFIFVFSSFFLFLCANTIYENKVIDLALKKKLYDNKVFKSLLFYKNKFFIKDKNFYLSVKRNLKSELIADIKGFFKKSTDFKNINNHPQCKFPARFLFLKHSLNLPDNIFPKIECPELEEYKKKAPADNIYIVFASANLKDPSSMMGHTFFKFEGVNYKSRKVSHAVSFFTLINTFNPFKLIYENIGPGMKGFFVLRPYKEILYNYLENQNRNIWEYKLKLNNFQKKFIYYHIWELRNIKMKYYFTAFNCATVDLFIVSIINPDILKNYQYYISPLDLIKLINKFKLIKKGILIPSDEWFIKLIEEQMNFFKIYKIKIAVENKNINKLSELNNFYEKLLAQIYAIYLFKHRKLSQNDLNKIIKNLKFKKNTFIDISKYKNPLKTPYQRQIGSGYFRDYDNKKYLFLNFLPASHTLEDDNREYFNESELKLGNIIVLMNKKKILLERLDIYTIYNLIPFDILTKPFSYDFSLNLRRDYDKKMNKKLYGNLKVGIGENFKFQDINLFFLLNGKMRINKKVDFLINPIAGISVYTIGKGKIIAKYVKNYTFNSLIYKKISLSYNMFLSTFKIYYNLSIINNKKREFSIGLSKYF